MRQLIRKTFFMILVSVTIPSCKFNQKTGALNNEVTSVGEIVSSLERNFTLAELEMGRRICNNLKNKRDFFEKLTNEKEQFRLRVELRNCDNFPYSYIQFIAAISNANSTDPEYIAKNENYFKDIITDQSGAIKTLCESLNQGNPFANTNLLGNFKYIFKILSIESYDTIQITKLQKNKEGSFKPISSESISFIGNKNQADSKFFGVEKNRIRYTMCDGQKYNTQKQVWIEAVTDFQL